MGPRAEHETAPIRVALVDDHPLIREGLERLFEAIPDVDLVGFAPTGELASALCRETRPDVLLMDLRLPGIDGIEAARRVTRCDPHVRVIILTSFASRGCRRRALSAGAVGCLAKDASAETMIAMIRGAEAARHAA